jgi:hypothetical protein
MGFSLFVKIWHRDCQKGGVVGYVFLWLVPAFKSFVWRIMNLNRRSFKMIGEVNDCQDTAAAILESTSAISLPHSADVPFMCGAANRQD